jgi:hypothetical protein
MSRLFPHAEYAEDQRLGHTILTTHVLARGATTGAIVGVGIMGGRVLYGSMFGQGGAVGGPSGAIRLFRAAGQGTLIGTALLAVALAGRMRGREDIEWRDRSWRLLENRGQVETDDWCLGGAVIGLGTTAAMMASGRTPSLGIRGLIGGPGLGSAVGVLGYLGWRYGVHGGKFD